MYSNVLLILDQGCAATPTEYQQFGAMMASSPVLRLSQHLSVAHRYVCASRAMSSNGATTGPPARYEVTVVRAATSSSVVFAGRTILLNSHRFSPVRGRVRNFVFGVGVIR